MQFTLFLCIQILCEDQKIDKIAPVKLPNQKKLYNQIETKWRI